MSTENAVTITWSADELIPFGKYMLLDRIHAGATSAVYRATVRGVTDPERVLTIKRILPHLAGDPDFVSAFMTEAKMVGRLRHPNICPLYELDRVADAVYMAMEWIPGKDLGRISIELQQRNRGWPPLLAAWISAKLCEALDHAHGLRDSEGRQAGIIHRDLSPANVLLSYKGETRLIDFGVAKAVGHAQHTNVEALKKKLRYMSPEMVKGLSVDARSDIFAVGILLYEMLSGRQPFDSQDDITALKLAEKAAIPPPSTVADGVPRPLEQIVMRALQRHPGDRYQTAGLMADALLSYVDSVDGHYRPERVSAFMDELFSEVQKEEHTRLLALLKASGDPLVLAERHRFFGASRDNAAPPDEKPTLAFPDSTTPVEAPPVHPDASELPTWDSAASQESRDDLATPRPSRRSTTPLGVFHSVDFTPPLARTPPRAAWPPPPQEEYLGEQDLEEPTEAYLGADQSDPLQDLLNEVRATPDQHPPPAAPPMNVHAAARPPAWPGQAPSPGTVLPGELNEGPAADEHPSLLSWAAQQQPSAPGQPQRFTTTGNLWRGEPQQAFLQTPDAPPFPLSGAGVPLERFSSYPPHNSAQIAQGRPPAQPAAYPLTKARRSIRPQSFPLALPPSDVRYRVVTRQEVWANRMLAAGVVLLGLSLIGLLLRAPLAYDLLQSRSATIEVRTVPQVGASVLLDEVHRGEAPLRIDNVPAGVHTVGVEARGFQPIARKLVLKEGGSVLLDVSLTKQP